MAIYIYQKDDELYHHGIKGQKWGIRRYQNPDGSLTPEGKMRYSGSNKINNLVKDATRLSEKGNAKSWAKTFNKLGVDPESYDVYIAKGKQRLNTDQRRMLSDIGDEYFKQYDAPELLKQYNKKNADNYKKERDANLEETINKRYPNLVNELGVKDTKEARQYVSDAVLGITDTWGDIVLTDDVDKGSGDLLRLKDYNLINGKIYDTYERGAASERAIDFLEEGYSSEDLRQGHDQYIRSFRDAKY